MAAPYHNLLSKNDRALVAYIVANGMGTIETVVPAKWSIHKPFPVTVCYSQRATEVAPFSATYAVESVIMIKTSASVDLGEDMCAPRLASEALVAGTFDLFHISIDSSAEKLAANITIAARALAVSNPVHFGDLADYTAIGIQSKIIEAGQEADGDAWIDTLHVTVICAPSDVL